MESVTKAPIIGKRVVVRCDFNVPIKEGNIQDDTRIKSSLQTLNYLLDKKANLTLLSHLGRPKGKEKPLSLKPVSKRLEELLGEAVQLLDKLDSTLLKGKITLLEDLRFWQGEEENSEDFAKQLSTMGEIYVNEAFSVCHRPDASIVGTPRFLPSFAGLNLIREIEELHKLLKYPQRPFIAIIGGAKIETKLSVIENLARVADQVLVGGKLMFEVDEHHLPKNVIVAIDNIETKDIGPKSVEKFQSYINRASTIVWNGPMGVFEDDKYINGTREVAMSMVKSGSYTIVGGGDTISALNKLGLIEEIKFISTGGGAMLEFLAGKKLPGLKALGFYD